ncbi:MAG: hypothetical protein K9H64_22020 [Bacteroidales bacterium]|nr:hypothetical protein [Bacteroidales bacterium]MCF8458707.1 hypothetical protein [Bacteroidales bacterium]
MKKNLTFTMLLLAIISITANATVWRVNNNPNIDADFTTLQDAIDGASAEDTLYIEGSLNSYGIGTFSKKLIVIGPGYWLNENDSTQAYKENAVVEQLVYNNGSQGSMVSGLYMNSGSYTITIGVNTDSITIEKNYMRNYYHYSSTYGKSINITGNRNSIIIRQNFITGYNPIVFTGIPSNTFITNNIIGIGFSSSSIAMATVANTSATDILISNNVIRGHITTYHAMHVNNILLYGNYNTGAGDNTMSNLCVGTQYPNTNNNQQNIVMDSVFVNYSGSYDHDYLLKPNSPAIGAGFNGTDCGVFGVFDAGYGGNQPYKLSGIPDIPSIFEAEVYSVGTTEIPVNIKAKSNN